MRRDREVYAQQAIGADAVMTMADGASQRGGPRRRQQPERIRNRCRRRAP